MANVLGFLRDRGVVVVSLATGVLAGVLIRFPAGWVLPDSAAAVIGSAAGAAITVGGAFMVLKAEASGKDLELSRRESETMEILADETMPALIALNDFFGRWNINHPNRLAEESRLLLSDLDIHKEAIEKVRELRNDMGVDCAFRFRLLQRTYRSLINAMIGLNAVARKVASGEAPVARLSMALGLVEKINNEIANQLVDATGCAYYERFIRKSE